MRNALRAAGGRSFLLGSIGLLLVGRLVAQPLNTLHSFNMTEDGYSPKAGVVISGDTLYGTTSSSVGGVAGTVFKLNKVGTGFTTLHEFPSGLAGGRPDTRLVLSGDTLYGLIGGSAPCTVFAINTDGTGFKILFQFRSDPTDPFRDGSGQQLALVADNVLYGTASHGGRIGTNVGFGTVFRLNTDGAGYTILHTFSGGSNGVSPNGALVLSGDTLYGMTTRTATTLGTVFRVNTDGTGFMTLHTFPDARQATRGSAGKLVLSGNVLYGTNPYGGTEQGSNGGTVFKLNTDGTGYADLYRLDGFAPDGLTLSGGVLYGIMFGKAATGGDIDMLFKLNADGTVFSTFYTFGAPTNALPAAELAISGNSLFGTTIGGGEAGLGTVFAVALPPAQLTISHTGQNICVKWPTSAAGLGLQCSENPAVSDAWTPVLLTPVIVDGQNTLTIPASGMHQFFRLR